MKKYKGKKIHFEVLTVNSLRMDLFIKDYNNDSKRVTPKIKYADVINQALDKYLSKREEEFKPRKKNVKE